MAEEKKNNFKNVDNQQNKIFNKKIYSALYQFTKPYKVRLFFILIFVLITVGCDLAIPLISKKIIDNYINQGYFYLNLESYTEFSSKFYPKYQDKLIKVAPNKFILHKHHDKIFVKEDLSFLKEKNLLKTEEIFYSLIKKEHQNLAGIEKNLKNQQYYDFEDYILINFTTLKELSPKSLIEIRSFDIAKIKIFAYTLLLIVIVNFIFAYWQAYSITVLGQKVMYDLRMSLFDRIQKLPLQFFDKNPTGILVTRVTNDIANLEEFFSSILVNLFKDIVILIGIIAVMLSIDVKLALISFTIIPIIVLVTLVFKKRIRVAYRRVRKSISKMNGLLAELLRGVMIIQIFGKEKAKLAEFSELNEDIFDANFKQMVLNAFFSPIISFIKYMATGMILYFGASFILASYISIGILVAFLAYIEKFFQPLQDIVTKINLLQSAMASSERIFSILEMEPEQDTATDFSKEIKDFEGRIKFENVWLAYEDENWVLKDFNLEINPGESIALVGPTGAGKSSVINILSRLYNINKGRITIDGIDIKNIPLKILRKLIGTVQQDVFLFSGTIRNNIVLDRKDISDEDFEKLTKTINSHKFIEKYDQNYQKELQEEGASISTGEKQLVSFTRMLCYDPKILILDEATSNIDTETEILIQEALEKLTNQRTSIIVAHRLSTIRHCNKIVVLQKGEIKEIGSHEKLLAQKGIYHKLYLLQYKENEFEV